MRDIKFRVFNKERSVMMSGVNQYGFHEPDNKIKTTSSGAFTRLWESIARINESDNFVLMQFTGLQDKNGVDIYEGDIVLVEYNYLGKIPVKFINGAFNITHFRIEKCSVIGNIHEDSELLS